MLQLQQRHSCGASLRTRNATSSRGSSARCHRSCTISARPAPIAAAAAAAATSSTTRGSLSSLSSQQQRVVGAAAASRSSRAARGVVVCRDAPRPMWAAKQAAAAPASTAGALVRMITREISQCDSITALEDVCNEWGGSFDYIHTAAALSKCVKLPRDRKGPALFQQLTRIWLQVLPDAETRQCANVLWACSRMGAAGVWDRTWQAYLKLLRAGSSADGKDTAQSFSNVLVACARLRKQPAAEDLQVLLHIMLQPDVLAAADAQNVANTAWALSQLRQQRGWRGGVSEQDMQQLLGEGQLQLLLAGTSQELANVLLALGRMAAGSAPVVSLSFAQAATKQLLAGAVQQRLLGWDAQNISNSLWACAALKLADELFVAAAIAAAPSWLPNSTGPDIRQAAFAAVKLELRDERFVEQLLVRANQIAARPPPRQHKGRNQGRGTDQHDSDVASSAGMCTWVVARLDMQRLAPAARELVAGSGIGKLPSTHPTNLSKLWVFHSWLLQLDGKGLAGVLTQQQLQQGAKGAAEYEAKQ